MREIKFRAWDRDAKQMVHSSSVRMRPVNIYDRFGLSKQADGRGYDLLQYTGLKDKNGVEVYESDVVRILGAVARPPTGHVVWHRAQWLIGPNADGWPLGGFNSADIEIIGNIYENPELLDGAA